MTQNPPLRALMGFIAAALSVLIFHQGMVAILHIAQLPGLGVGAPWSLDPVAPLGVPRVLDLCFWGGVYGVVFGLLAPSLPRPLWLTGLAFGILAVLVGMFVVPAIKGLPVGGGWALMNWVRSFLINGAWGIGLGIIFPMVVPGAARLRQA